MSVHVINKIATAIKLASIVRKVMMTSKSVTPIHNTAQAIQIIGSVMNHIGSVMPRVAAQ